MDDGGHTKNTTITSLIFDLTSNMMNQNERYFSGSPPPSLFFNLPMKFYASLSNVRRVQLIVNRDQVRIFLQKRQCQQLISECPQLDRVIIQLSDSEEFTRKAVKIEQRLCLSRPEMIFRIINA
jgi:hypothetical protein